MRKKPSTKPSGNSAQASPGRDVEKRFVLGTCTKKQFAKPRPLSARNDKPGQQSLVNRHSDDRIYADGMQLVDLFLSSNSTCRNQLPARDLAQWTDKILREPLQQTFRLHMRIQKRAAPWLERLHHP